MNVFLTHQQVVEDCAAYIQSFLNIADAAIRLTVEPKPTEPRLWPASLQDNSGERLVAQLFTEHDAAPEV